MCAKKIENETKWRKLQKTETSKEKVNENEFTEEETKNTQSLSGTGEGRATT